LPGFGAGSACCARADGAAKVIAKNTAKNTAMIAAKPKRPANRRFVMSVSSVCVWLERFQAKWLPVRVKKTRQIKNLELCSDSIGTEL
jgi:hypothetical protein